MGTTPYRNDVRANTGADQEGYEREVLLLARVQGQSTEQIAAAMGRTEGAVRVLLCRAQARLVMLAGEA